MNNILTSLLKHSCFILLPSISFMLYSCGGAGCEMNYPCTSINYGNLSLTDSSDNWLPVSIDSVIIKNNAGFTAVHSANYFHSSSEITLSYRTEKVGPPCGESQNCEDYCQVEREGWNYGGPDLSFAYSYYRTARLPSDYNYMRNSKPDPATIYNAGDWLVVGVGRTVVGTDFSNTTFYPTYTINSLVVDSVYELEGHDNYPYGGLYVSKIYFRKGKGIVGYTLSNNEIWSVEIK